MGLCTSSYGSNDPIVYLWHYQVIPKKDTVRYFKVYYRCSEINHKDIHRLQRKYYSDKPILQSGKRNDFLRDKKNFETYFNYLQNIKKIDPQCSLFLKANQHRYVLSKIHNR